MTDEADITERLKQVIVDLHGNHPKDEVKLESRFTEDLGFDSLDVVELMMAVEDEFDLMISDEEAETLKSVGDAVRFIKERVS